MTWNKNQASYLVCMPNATFRISWSWERPSAAAYTQWLLLFVEKKGKKCAVLPFQNKIKSEEVENKTESVWCHNLEGSWILEVAICCWISSFSRSFRVSNCKHLLVYIVQYCRSGKKILCIRTVGNQRCYRAPPPPSSNFDLDRIRSSIKLLNLSPPFLHFQTFLRPRVCMYGLVVAGRREAFSTSSLVVRQVYFLEITRTVCRRGTRKLVHCSAAKVEGVSPCS